MRTVAAAVDVVDGGEREAAELDDVEVDVRRLDHVQKMVRHARLLFLRDCSHIIIIFLLFVFSLFIYVKDK
jgi:hypothetical protein